jgi:putative nucleotidyltransferase with HDIG domain
MRSVKVRDLEPGQTVAGDVSNLHGQIIMPAGTVIAPRLLAILKAWGIAEITVEGNSSESPPTAEPPSDVAAAGGPGEHRDGNDPSHPALVEIMNLASRLKVKPADLPAELSSPATARAASQSPAAVHPRPTWPPISAEFVARRAGTLASLPTIQFKVERAINHPASSAADIAAVLSSDQALCARLLRIANSAFYGFPRHVEGIGEAVRIIGTRQLHDLVLATVVLAQFRGVDPSLVSMKSFWQHSLACGLASRAIASLRRESNTERFFVAGLLHDIGSLVLYQQFAERAHAALQHHHNTKMALDESERAIIGCDHGAVGAALIAAWKLPQFFRDAVAKHHGQGRQSHTPGTAIVHLADFIAMALGLGSNGEEHLPPFNSTAWNLIGLEVSALGRVADQVLEQIADAERSFLAEGSGP